MKLADFSVSRPIFISMFACIVLVLGGISLNYLPVDLFPEIDFPACSITTFYDDASPQEVEDMLEFFSTTKHAIFCNSAPNAVVK